jgi:hypothetical protein
MRGANRIVKEFKSGNTTVRIHSPIVHLTDQERKAHFEEQIANKNPVYIEIVEAIQYCYNKRHLKNR